MLTRRELAFALIICGLGAALFLWPAVFGGRVLSPSDLLFLFYPWRAQPPPGFSIPGNSLMWDPVFVFEPWLRYASERLHAGEIPLWNPQNMLGAPFIGNMQSAVFYPLNWPGFVWPDTGALALRAWLKLVCAGFGAYVLARQVLRVGPLAASLAAVCFAFGAFMTVWLLYPLTNAAVLLPWLWWATARVVVRPGARRVAALAVVVALSLFAGHPETAYHIALASGLFMLFTVLSSGQAKGEMVKGMAAWGLGYGLGALLAAIQLVPFGEYISQSTVFGARTGPNWEGFWLRPRFAWTIFSPGLFGNPAHGNWWDQAIIYNYNETNSYIGLLPLLLAPPAFFARDRARRRIAGFLVLLALLAAAVVYHVPVVYGAVTSLPFLHAAANHRLVLIVEFAFALLAALGVERLVSAPTPVLTVEADPTPAPAGKSGFLLLGVILVTTTVLGLLGTGVPLLAPGIFELPAGLPAPVQVWEAGLRRGGVVLLLSGGLLAGVCLLMWRWPRVGRRAAWLLPLFLLADLWQAHIGYNPTVAARDYFPRTGLTSFLEAQPGISRSARLLSPNSNLAYGLSVVTGYDAVTPSTYNDLVTYIDPTIPQNKRRHFNANEMLQSRIWNLLNVRFVAAMPGDDPNYLTDINQTSDTGHTVGGIRGNRQTGQTFKPTHDNLAGIDVLGATSGGKATGQLIFHLKTDPAAATDLLTRTLGVAGLPDDRYWQIRFQPILHTKGRSFYFYFNAAGDPAVPATLWYNSADAYPGGTRTEDGSAVAGDLVFRTESLFDPIGPWLVRVYGGDAEASVFENQKSLPRAWLVHSVKTTTDPAASVVHLYNPSFDWTRAAMLNAPLPADEPLPAAPPPAASETVSITLYAPERVVVGASSPAASLLVLSDQAFPGWEATVDGRPAPILTADHALRGVYLPAGKHRVQFDYRPASFAWGAALTAMGLLIALALFAWPLGSFVSSRLRSPRALRGRRAARPG